MNGDRITRQSTDTTGKEMGARPELACIAISQSPLTVTSYIKGSEKKSFTVVDAITAAHAPFFHFLLPLAKHIPPRNLTLAG
jgi:hypothetical protein